MTGIAGTALMLIWSSALFAQGGRGIFAHTAANDNKPYEKHDLSGIWSRNGSRLCSRDEKTNISFSVPLFRSVSKLTNFRPSNRAGS